MTKLFQDMENSLRYGMIVSILLLYIHFRAQVLLKVEPEGFIDSVDYLRPMIFVVLISVLVQVFFLLVEFFLEPDPISVTMMILTAVAVNAGVAGITYAAVST